MWRWLGIAFAIGVVIYLLLWARNIFRSVKSGDFQYRLDNVRDGQPVAGGATDELLQREQEKAGTTPDATPSTPFLNTRDGWIAIPSEDVGEVLAAMDLAQVQVCNYTSADAILRSLLNQRVFLSESLDGWVFLTGPLERPQPEHPKGGLWQFLVDLSKRFGEAQYFFFSSTTMENAWARAVQGEMVRAYYFAGHEDVIVWNHGAITEGERQADMVYGESGYVGAVDEDDVEDNPDCCLMEEAAEMIAEQWSLEPISLYGREDLEPGTGWLGFLKTFDVKQR